MKILITGATGFIGSRLITRLMQDHELFCVGRKVDNLPVSQQVHAVQLDLSSTVNTSSLPATVDAIIHLAQSRHFRQFPDRARDIFKVNTDSTLQLLEYGRQAKIKVFLLASSGGVCGYQPRPIVETDPAVLVNFYLASKYAAECLVNAYDEYFVPVILRYFFVYGEGQRDMFMPSLARRVLQGTPVTIAGKSGVRMNPIHVFDAIDATVQALQLERAETINVAGAETTTVMELAEMVGKLAGRIPTYSFEPDKGSLAMVANVEKMKLKLGASPKVSLQEGLSRLVKDLLQNN
jgi:UDP-glucose 4-epimerase